MMRLSHYRLLTALLLIIATPAIHANQFMFEPVASLPSNNNDNNWQQHHHSGGNRLFGVIRDYWYLGIIGFGGTPAHVALLHCQQQRNYDDETLITSSDDLLDLTALLHAIPGPTSTQLVIATASCRAGILGAMVALLFWTLPGFMALTLAGLGRSTVTSSSLVLFLKGIPPAAVVLALQSVIQFGASLDGIQKLIAVAVCILSGILTSGSGYAAKAIRGGPAAQFLVPLLLAGGGLVTFVQDWYRERSAAIDMMPFSEGEYGLWSQPVAAAASSSSEQSWNGGPPSDNRTQYDDLYRSVL